MYYSILIKIIVLFEHLKVLIMFILSYYYSKLSKGLKITFTNFERQ